MVASDFGAVALLGDLDRIEDGFHVGIAGTGRGVGLNAAEDGEKGRGLVGEVAGGLLALGVEVGAGMDGGQHAQRDHDIAVAGESDIDAAGQGERGRGVRL